MTRNRFFQAVLAVGVLAAATVLPQAAAFATVGEVYGPYLLVEVYSGKCLDNPASSASNNTTMDIYTCLGSANEQWYNEPPLTDVDYWTFNGSSHKCLTVKNASQSPNAAVIQYTCTTGANERWVYVAQHGGYSREMTIAGRTWIANTIYEIRNVNSGLCLTVKNEGRDNNDTLVQHACDDENASNGWWQFRPA